MLSTISRGPNPVDLPTARKFFRLYDEEHDGIIALLLDAAVADIERYTRQTFVRTAYQWSGTVSGVLWTFPRFPVIELTEVYSLTDSIAKPLDGFDVDDSRIPPALKGQIPYSARITWTAGYTVVPADVKLLILQRAYEAFERPGSHSPDSIGFSPTHRMMLEGLCTQHDAIR